MNKLVCLLLVLVLTLSLTACDETQQAPTDASVTESSETESIEVKPTMDEVVLTTQNWKDYFNAEMTVVNGDLVESYDEFDEVSGAEIYRFYYLTLKDEYKDRLTNFGNSRIQFETSCKYGNMDNSIRLSTMSVSWGEKDTVTNDTLLDETISLLSSNGEIAIAITEDWVEMPVFYVYGADIADYGIFVGYEYASASDGCWGSLSDNFANVQGSLFFAIEN